MFTVGDYVIGNSCDVDGLDIMGLEGIISLPTTDSSGRWRVRFDVINREWWCYESEIIATKKKVRNFPFKEGYNEFIRKVEGAK